MEIRNSGWITVSESTGDVCPVFRTRFSPRKKVARAELEITALGVYEAFLNGRPVSDEVLSPGWTSYHARLQVQTRDVTALLQKDSELRVQVGRGWWRSPMPGWLEEKDREARRARPCGLICALRLRYTDGTEDVIRTDGSWEWAEGPVRFSEIYDGESYDARVEPRDWKKAVPLAWPKDILIPNEGEPIRETERVAARRVFRTPAGETVADFGQEVTGYVEFTVRAKAGDRVVFHHGEVLDREGNFYFANYRGAKARVEYTCREGEQTWHPRLTFFGFRYIRILAWPGEVRAEDLTAIAVHSDMRRTGWLASGHADMNRLISNIVWGQRGNFLDVPTDCPQRDERMGWTGDAQVFARTASYLFDTERFFRKWLRDMAADQRPNGEVGMFIPEEMPRPGGSSCAWGDAAAICPWQVYQTYGDRAVLEDQFDCMRRWVDFITSDTTTQYLWTGRDQLGDWLGLDAPQGSCKGSSREDLIASAFYAQSCGIVVKTGRVLGRDVSQYEALEKAIREVFRKAFPDGRTQTELALCAAFELSEDPRKTADDLAELVRKDGVQLRTGFVGTPYILQVLSRWGHADLAWDLVLRREYPGWLYPVSRGATTIWEHWDGIREDGTFWSPEMNSFNHYAYGAVGGWLFEQAAGIRHAEDRPGFEELVYDPHPDARVGWLDARLDTRRGTVRARWTCTPEGVRYELETPVRARVCLGGGEKRVEPGRYTFWTES